MSNFSPPPTNGLNNCDKRCPSDHSCFVYSGGLTCQPFQAPFEYPITGANNTQINPPQWYLANSYPVLRYTGSLANQTLGANCTTIPVPFSDPRGFNDAYSNLMGYIINGDLGAILTRLDSEYWSTLAQYRGNCAQEFYCQPSVPINTISNTQKTPVRGELPGTCQVLREVSQSCLSTNMCQNWHVQSDGSFGNGQVRCVPPPNPSSNWTPSGLCEPVEERRQESMIEKVANMYLYSTIVLLLLLFLYIWYRRQKNRQLQALRACREDSENSRPDGVHRLPDENDNGELPTYEAHRRDERIVGSGSEAYDMYVYPSRGQLPPNGVHPSGRPQGAMHPPPSREPSGPLTSHQTMAAVAIISQEATRLREGSLPPAYDPASTTPHTPPSPTIAAAAAAAAAAVASNTATTGTTGAMERTGVIEDAQLTTEEKQGLGHPTPEGLSPPKDPLQLSGKKKSSLSKDQESDQASTSTSSSSSSGSGSGSRSNSSAIPDPNSKN